MPVVTVDEQAPVPERGLVSLPEDVWQEARRRAAVIGPLAAMRSVSVQSAEDAGRDLGLSRRQVYSLVKRYRQGSGLVTDLAPGRSEGGRGGARLPDAVESVVGEVVRNGYLDRQRLSLAVVHRDIARACTAKGLPVPARNTVARRVAALHPARVAVSREGVQGARGLQGEWEIPREDHLLVAKR